MTADRLPPGDEFVRRDLADGVERAGHEHHAAGRSSFERVAHCFGNVRYDLNVLTVGAGSLGNLILQDFVITLDYVNRIVVFEANEE